MKKAVPLMLLLLLSLLSLFVGVSDLSWGALLHGDRQQLFLLTTTRLPRTISLILAGAAISLCGLIMQHLTQNKFVSPMTAGTMDSARLGILVVLLFFPNASFLIRSFIACSFAFLGTMAFLGIIRLLPSGKPVLLPLVGMMFGNIIGAIATFFAYQFQLVQNMSSWLQGNFSLVMKGTYEGLFLTIPVLILLQLFAYRFTIVGMGADFAANLGLDYSLMRTLGVGLIAFASSLVLILVGSVPFLGIVVPNLVSLLFGDHLKNTSGLVALVGSCFLLSCDLFSRIIIAPYEVPVSLTVGIVGSVLFLTLLLRRKSA